MKYVLLLMLLISSTAHSAYYRCVGKKGIVDFGIDVDGVKMTVTKVNEERVFFKGDVTIEEVTFKDNSSKKLSNVATARAYGFYGSAELDLIKKSIDVFNDDGKVLYTDKRLQCEFFAGQ